MSKAAVRRKIPANAASIESVKISKATNNNNAGEVPKKRARINFQLPLPERLNVLGRALACGQGELGQLGLGDDESKFERRRPALVEGVTHVVDLVAGGMHNLVLTADGRVFSFGCNDEGALGRNTSEEGSEFTPALVTLPGKVVKMSAGDSHSAVLLENGSVYAWGSFRDSHGNMGLTLEGNKFSPINLLPGAKCADIASGADHLVILTCSGKIYTVGCGEQGQLGRVSKRSISGEGRRGKQDLLRPLEVIIMRVKNVGAIWATNYCTFVRDAVTDKIWAFGLNNYKQIGYPKKVDVVTEPVETSFDDVKQIAGGQHHTLVLKNDGSCYSIGRHDYGRLGLGNLKEDVEELRRIEKLPGNVVFVGCGESQSFAITEDGKLYSWGMGSSHQLGTGEEDDADEPVHIVSKQTEGKRLLRASGGGQHSIFMVEDLSQPALEVHEPKAKKEEAKDAKAKEEKLMEDKAEKKRAKEEKAKEEKAKKEKAKEEKAKEQQVKKEEKAKVQQAKKEEKAKEQQAKKEEKAKEKQIKKEKATEEAAKETKLKEAKAKEVKVDESKPKIAKAKVEKVKGTETAAPEQLDTAVEQASQESQSTKAKAPAKRGATEKKPPASKRPRKK